MGNITSNLNIPWDYKYLSKFNPNISWEIVQANQLNQDSIPWNYEALSKNPMTKAKNDFIRNKFREHLARKGIKEEMIKKIMNPKFLGKTADEQVERLKQLGIYNDEDDEDEDE